MSQFATQADYWKDRALKAEERLKHALAEVRDLQGFADLWYFAMDNAPGDFERIVTDYSPSMWMHKIAALKRGEKV